MDSSKLGVPPVSVLICSRDRRNELNNLLNDLKKQDYPVNRMQIVVVEETDSPADIKRINYVSLPYANKGIAHARNIALKHAIHDLVAFIDDDCRVTPDWLSTLVNPFVNSPEICGVQGGVAVNVSTNSIGYAESILGFPGGGIRRVALAKGKWQATKEISTLNCAYRKSSIEKAGGFDERLNKGGEDYVLAKQVCQNGGCLFIPEALVYHQARGNLLSVWRWFVRRGRAETSLILAKVLKNITFLSFVRSSFTVKIFFFLLLMMFFPTIAGPLLALGALGYISIQYIRYYRPYRLSKAPVAGILVLPIVKLIMDIGMDWGRLTGFFIE